jgi:hypothetical protein
MVRLFIHSLFVAPLWAACPAAIRTSFSAEGGKTHNDAGAACDDLVASVKAHLGELPCTVDLKSKCLAEANSLSHKAGGQWYDPLWSPASDCTAAVSSLKDQGWLTCSGEDSVCFSGNPKEPLAQTQKRFNMAGDKGSSMCSALGAALSPRNGPLEAALGMGAAKVTADCQKALSSASGYKGQTCSGLAGGTSTQATEGCFIDTLDQLCATALLDNDASLQKERHGCHCKGQAKHAAKGGSERDLIQAVIGKGKTYDRIELVVFDAEDAQGSTNVKVASLEELSACLKCRECGNCGGGCKVAFPDTQPYWSTTGKSCSSPVHLG